MSQTFRDREGLRPPPTGDELPEAAWRGIASAFHRTLDSEGFAKSFPIQCSDGNWVAGTSRGNLLDTLIGLIPEFTGLPDSNRSPGTIPAMEMLEFGWKHVAKPESTSSHSYFGHDHLSFDVKKGRAAWRVEVNEMLRRNGVALLLTEDGQVERIAPVTAQVILRSGIPPTGDGTLDALIGTALQKYHEPDVRIRCESLEQLWDALERVKTVLDSDKKRGAQRLVQLMASSPENQRILETELKALTTIGNDFQIRHHETYKFPVDADVVDHLFQRGLGFLEIAARRLASRPTPGPDTPDAL